MSKHTPGPWRYVVEDRARNIVAPSGSQLCATDTLMSDTKYYPWCPEKEADWILIAAAPALLEALQVLVANNESLVGESVARAAIAAATGTEAPKA